MILDITTVLVFAIVLLLGHWMLKKPSRLPPGPSRLEAMAMINPSSRDKFLLDCCRKYKDLFSLHIIGTERMIFIHGFDLIKHLFVHNAEYFSNRSRGDWLVDYLYRGKGISFNYDSWKQARRFALHGMKDFGLGKQSLEERIQDEAENLIEAFNNKNGEAFDPEEDIVKAVSNIICSITFGKRYKYDDPDFELVLKNITEYLARPFIFSPLNGAPWLRHFGFLSNSISVEYFEEHALKIKEFIRKEIANHRKDYDPNNIGDLIDLCIQIESSDSEDTEWMDEGNLCMVIFELFGGGTDTTTGTLRWLLLHLIHNPDVQKKCQEEIFNVIGTDRLPEYKERNSFPYTMAKIQEAQRIDTVTAGSLSRNAEKDFEIGKYVIPKGMTVYSVNKGLMYDKKIWGDDVERFRPERWLDKDGKLQNVPEFIPFSTGKRVCPGKQLAKTELFITTVALLQKFSFLAEDPINPPKIERLTGLTTIPKPFRIVAKPVPVQTMNGSTKL